jgi:predicted enzyme related to lactoylglutathione lyase
MTINYQKGQPSWVDLGTSDVDAAVAFYGSLFGWTADPGSEETGGYRNFRKNGKMVAGIGPTMDPNQPIAWSVYFDTDDSAATATAVTANGGSVIVEPMQVLEFGTMAVFADPAGAMFGTWQQGTHRGAELAAEHGTFGWAELTTTDIAAVKAFYPAVFPVSVRDVDMGEGTTYTLLELDGEAIAGAMTPMPDGPPQPPHWAIYFNVDDTDAAVATAAANGGKVAIAAMDTPAGRMAVLSDPQGGVFSVITPDPDFKP